MKIVEVNVFEFEELSDKAKEKARDWWREGGLHHDWWEFVFEDFVAICNAIGIDVHVRYNYLPDGSVTSEPNIVFEVERPNGGDFASFSGSWSYKQDAQESLAAYAPKDEVLRGIAADLQEAQDENDGELIADICYSGYGDHMVAEVSRKDHVGVVGDAEVEVPDIIERLNDWLQQSLAKELDYRMSDETVDEDIICNGYEFTEDGKRFVTEGLNVSRETMKGETE